MRDLFSKSVKRSGHRILTTTKDPPIFGAPYKTDSSENFGRKVLKRKRRNELPQHRSNPIATGHQNHPEIQNWSFQPGCCFPASTFVFMIISLMIATLLILTLCGFAVAFVRYRTRRNGQRALQRFRESYQLERPNMMNVHDREIAMLEAQIRETLDRASQVPRADQPVKIEAGPKDMAGVVGFLAQHQIEDEALEFRSTNPNVIIVPKCYQGVEPGGMQSSTFLSTEPTGTTLPVVPTTLPATKSTPVHRTDAKRPPRGNAKPEKRPKGKFLSKLCTRKSKRGIAKPKKQNKASKADSSRKVNRRVGWSDSEQKHQVIAA